MKWLIGAACVAAIAASGVYLSKQYDAVVVAHAAEQAQIEAREALFTFARAKPDEGEKVASVCRVAFANPDVLGSATSQRVVNTCRMAGISTAY